MEGEDPMAHEITTTEFGGTNNRNVIRGELLKYNASNGGWNLDLDDVLVTGTLECVQRWQGSKPIETLTEQPLPDVEKLNKLVPRDQWEIGLNGEPRPPWQVQRAVYLIDPADGASFTYVSGTIGARIAVEALNERVETMRKLRGENVLPMVELGSKIMFTRYGERRRPDFTITGWQSIGVGAKAIEHKVADETDEPPFDEFDDAVGV
jgi:hypothetical protein